MTDRIPSDLVLETAGAWCLKLAAGPLNPDEQQHFETWIQSDREHRRAFEDAVGVWRAVSDTAATPTLIGLRQEALASFEHANRSKWQPRKFGRRRPILFALTASLVLATGALGVWRASGSTTYRTGIAERRAVVLADGSKISLDALTQVVVRYTGSTRALRLESGRAKFEVAKDAARPFTVQAADKSVIATGTAFSVELLHDTVEVVLYEGHVEVMTDHPGSKPEPVKIRDRRSARAANLTVAADQELTPGRALVVPIAASVADVVAADPIRSLAWEGGQLIFASESLASAVEQVNRYSDRKVSLGDDQVGRIPIDGVFAAGDTAAFVEGVTGVFPIRARDTGDGVILTQR